MKNSNQRVMLSKRLLKEGLLNLLRSNELEEISISQLCAESGINRATFYRHYKTPKDVLYEIEMDIVNDLKTQVSFPRSISEAQIYLEKLCTYFYEHKELGKILIRCNTDSDIATMIQELHHFLWTHKLDHKSLQRWDEDNLRLISTFIGSGGYFLLRQWIMEDIPKSPKEIAALLSHICARTPYQ